MISKACCPLFFALGGGRPQHGPHCRGPELLWGQKSRAVRRGFASELDFAVSLFTQAQKEQSKLDKELEGYFGNADDEDEEAEAEAKVEA